MRICREAGERIQEIIDGEVPRDRARETLQLHLDACERCGREADTIRELKRAIARVGLFCDPALVSRLERFCGELADRESGADGRT
jgi:anti-sigma factor RsiW